eukprot:CAMPEP_0181220864 /NCGR_PEP_ID=MMETSP1096-20121128/29071_1 /TAXON_ID=156174 ORGANISM="Chrysochromulina ericina, Strain CCMP281" /NCGR_SAMPLE_ID=MMETSP1096 /ASSEMBLY_ACC=CAM_ASM_000453 /LENGTH=64 /DNA_ID=CAMNT_0023313409 /DNA_START=190 /DNA_END=384 /DNA_ORIENTATION=+
MHHEAIRACADAETTRELIEVRVEPFGQLFGAFLGGLIARRQHLEEGGRRVAKSRGDQLGVELH